MKDKVAVVSFIFNFIIKIHVANNNQVSKYFSVCAECPKGFEA